MGFYFFDEVLVGHEFLSSWAEDHTDFDEKKVSTIVKGKTTRAEVIQLLGQLHAADVLQCDVPPDTAELFRRREQQERRVLMKKVFSVFAWQIPLFDPERVLGRLMPFARPFFGRELSSRVAAVLRRSPDRRPAAYGIDGRRAPTPPSPFGQRPIRAAGRILELTPKEAAILVQLATSGGAVRSRRQLIETIWSDGDAPADRCIDSHVKSLRRKLGEAGRSVETVRGVGYRFAPHPDLDLG